jgi:hypothetical protein
MKLNTLQMYSRVQAVVILVACASLWSCSGSSDEPTDPKEMRDESGLNIDLEWNTGGSTTQAINEVDLDLRLKKGTTIVETSYSAFSFEQVQIKDIYADGEYTIEIYVDYASKASNYKVFINGIKTDDPKEYTGTTSTSEDGATIEFIKITKLGTKYTLSR